MGKFLNTVLLGVGIGLLIAPKRGEETRRLLKERLQSFVGSGSRFANEQLDQYKSSDMKQTSQTAEQLKDVAQEALQPTDQPSTLTKEPFSPAYPEYVNPET